MKRRITNIRIVEIGKIAGKLDSKLSHFRIREKEKIHAKNSHLFQTKKKSFTL